MLKVYGPVIRGMSVPDGTPTKEIFVILFVFHIIYVILLQTISFFMSILT